MIQIFHDTLRVGHKWSLKRIQVAIFSAVSIVYAFTPLLAPAFVVNEFVFMGFLAAAGFGVYRLQKKNENNEQPQD